MSFQTSFSACYLFGFKKKEPRTLGIWGTRSRVRKGGRIGGTGEGRSGFDGWWCLAVTVLYLWCVFWVTVFGVLNLKKQVEDYVSSSLWEDCLVIVVPGRADHIRLQHPQGFNLKIAACFAKVSILMFKGNRGRRNNLWSLVHKQPRIKHEICDSSPPVFSLSLVPVFLWVTWSRVAIL